MAIVISTPAAHTSFVRTIPMTGTFSAGAPVSIEAQLGTAGWVVVDPAPGGGVWAGTLPYAFPNTGALQVRFSNDHAVTASIDDVTVTSNGGVPDGVVGGSARRKRRS